MNNIAEIHENVYSYLTQNYPELTFSLRKINRSKRLEAGYWFHGNDSYLLFTFWDSWDWKTQTPIIYFSIWIGNPNIITLTIEPCPVQEINAKLLKLKQKFEMNGNYSQIPNENFTGGLDKVVNEYRAKIELFITDYTLNDIFKRYDQKTFERNQNNLSKYRQAIDIKKLISEEPYKYASTLLNNLSVKNIG